MLTLWFELCVSVALTRRENRWVIVVICCRRDLLCWLPVVGAICGCWSYGDAVCNEAFRWRLCLYKDVTWPNISRAGSVLVIKWQIMFITMRITGTACGIMLCVRVWQRAKQHRFDHLMNGGKPNRLPRFSEIYIRRSPKQCTTGALSVC